MTASRLFSAYAPGGLPWRGEIDADLLCAICGCEFATPLSNASYNPLVCPQCANQLEQFVNATPHTIRPNSAIMGAHLHSIGTSLPERGSLRLYNTLDVINGRAESVIQVCRIGEPHRPPFFEHRTPIISPNRNFGSWEMSCVVPIAFFPRRACRIAVELSVANTWGDHLSRHLSMLNTLDLFRRIIHTDLKRLAKDQPTLTREFHALDTQGATQDDRYVALVCHLADYLLS